MHPQQIQQSSLLDIIFEHRNKTYGAYLLRKQYNNRLAAGLICSLFTGLVLVLLMSNQQKEISMPAIPPVVVELFDLPPKSLIAPTPPQLPPAAPATEQASIKDNTPLIIPDQPIVDLIPTIEELDASLIGSEKRNGDESGVNTSNSGQGGMANSVAPPIIASAEPSIYEAGKVEEQAEFPGGKEALNKFLKRNLSPSAIEENKRIQVMVKFVIDPSGEIGLMSLIKEGGEIYDREVLRVIRKMPKWKPARQNGKFVSMYFVLPVTFISEAEE